MTTLTSWLSVSGPGKRTFYLGADSQGTDAESGKVASHSIKKVFVSGDTPEIFVFAGDVAWGSHFLRNLLRAIGQGKVVAPLGSYARADEICALACARTPKNPPCGLEILYGVRGGADGAQEFQLYELKHAADVAASWEVCRVAQEELAFSTSTLVYSGGLGAGANSARQRWIAMGDQGDVARSYFWSLCDLVDSVPRNDLMTGGFPQLAKLDAAGPGFAVGVKYYGKPTVFGSRANAPELAASFWGSCREVGGNLKVA